MTPLAVVGLGFLFGLVNAAHCAGMCGVFALRAAGGQKGLSCLPPILTYTLGKSFTYTFLGALAGLLGASVIRLAAWPQALLTLLVAGALVLAGLSLLRPLGRARGAGGRQLARLMAPLLGALPPGDSLLGRFTLGAVTGAVPCGVVYLALLQALALGSPARAALFMASFGLGTLPILAVVGLLGVGIMGRPTARCWRVAGGWALLLLAAFTLYRGAMPFVRS